MTTVVLGSPAGKTEEARTRLRNLGWEVRLPDLGRHTGEDELIEALRGADGVVAAGEAYTRRVLLSTNRLRVIGRTGIGFDSIDIATATERSIAVCTALGSNESTVADWTVMSMLALARRVLDGHALLAGGGVAKHIVGVDFAGKTVGVVGTGAIGRHVIRRVRGFDCPVLCFDAMPDTAFAAAHGARYVDLDVLLRESDFVTLHVPLTPGTRHLINAGALAVMKRSAFLVNTARGNVVDEQALYETLRDRRIAGAALDVFAKEPLDVASPLRGLDNVILSPHSAGVTVESMGRGGEIAVENVIRVLSGQPPVTCLNPAALRR